MTQELFEKAKDLSRKIEDIICITEEPDKFVIELKENSRSCVYGLTLISLDCEAQTKLKLAEIKAMIIADLRAQLADLETQFAAL